MSSAESVESYARLRAGLLAAAPRSKKRRKKNQKRLAPCDTVIRSSVDADVLRVQKHAVSACIYDRLRSWHAGDARGWDQGRITALAAAAADLAFGAAVTNFHATPRQFLRRFIPFYWLCLVVRDVFLSRQYSGNESAELLLMARNPTLFGRWVMALPVGAGDVLACDDFRREMESAVLLHHETAVKKKPARQVRGGWHDAVTHAFTRKDDHGVLSWSQKHEVQGRLVISRDDKTMRYCASYSLHSRPHEIYAYVVHASDACVTAFEAIGVAKSRLHLYDLDTVASQERAKVLQKLLGRMKTEVRQALPTATCCPDSAHRKCLAFEVAWTASLRLQPDCSGATWAGERVLANIPGPFMWLLAELRGDATQSRAKMKAERAVHQKRDAARFFLKDKESQWSLLVWKNMQQVSSLSCYIDDETTPAPMREVHVDVQVRFPRLTHDSVYKKWYDDRLAFLVVVIRDDFATLALAAENNGEVHLPSSQTWCNYASGKALPAGWAVHTAFRQMHDWISHHRSLCWTSLFANRKLYVPMGEGRGGVTFVYGTVQQAIRTFDRLRLDVNGMPQWYSSTVNSSKVLNVMGGSWNIKIPTDAPDGGLLGAEPCSVCHQAMTTRIFSPCGGGFMCLHCKFAEIGACDFGTGIGPSEVSGVDGHHEMVPPFWHNHLYQDRIHRFFMSMACEVVTTVPYAEGGKLIEEREFFAPDYRFVYHKGSGNEIGSLDKPDFPEACRVDSREVIVSGTKERGTVAVGRYQLPNRLFSGPRVGIPTRHGIDDFFVWLTVDGRLTKHADLICTGPHHEMDVASLKRAFSIFLAARDGGEAPFIASLRSYEEGIRRELQQKSSLDTLLIDESDDDEDGAYHAIAFPASGSVAESV